MNIPGWKYTMFFRLLATGIILVAIPHFSEAIEFKFKLEVISFSEVEGFWRQFPARLEHPGHSGGQHVVLVTRNIAQPFPREPVCRRYQFDGQHFRQPHDKCRRDHNQHCQVL